MRNSNTGIIYKKTGVRSRGRMTSYHSSPVPNWLNKTPYNVDLVGLKPSEKRRVIRFDNGEFESRYCVGFEIEKLYFTRNSYDNRGDNIGELELFKGFELDSSCGVEGITHILPLLPHGKWKNKVFDMFYKSRYIIDEEHSPSDRNCGGHITLSCKGLSSVELFEKIRRYSGLIMSLYRLRLVNEYCRYNMTMRSSRSESWINGYRHNLGQRHTDTHYKYCFCKIGNHGTIEFRVPPRVQGVKQLMRRYELFYELIDCSVSGVTYTKFLSRVKPILTSMFPVQPDKVKMILRDSKYFQKFIDTNGDYTNHLTDTFIECTTPQRQLQRTEYISTNN
jgi:hypothetical protein